MKFIQIDAYAVERLRRLRRQRSSRRPAPGAVLLWDRPFFLGRHPKPAIDRHLKTGHHT